MELAPAPLMLEELKNLARDVPLNGHTTFKLGGPASFFVTVTSYEELRNLIPLIRGSGMPWFILGGGSNVVFPDEGYPGVVVHMCTKGIAAKSLQGGGVLVVAQAGEAWDDLVAYTVEHGLYGVENLSWIPGTAGAAPIQNIGAYGVELSDVLEWVEVYDTRTDTTRRLSKEACRFGYRTSLFKNSDARTLIVTRVALSLSTRERFVTSYKDVADHVEKLSVPLSLARMRAIIGLIRAQKFPDVTHIGTAGSYFKNPILACNVAHTLVQTFPGLPCYDLDDGMCKVSIAWILDHVLNLRGVRTGNIGTFERQPLVFVAYPGATTHELRTFADNVSKNVHAKTGIQLSPEVVFVSV